MEDLSIHTGSPTVHWSDNKSCIYVVEAKRVTPIILKIDIPVCFIQEKWTIMVLLTNYDKYSVMQTDMCTKPCSGLIISWGTKWVTGIIFYPTSDTEQYQTMILHEFIGN